MSLQGVIRKPRQAAGFRGTVRYAPIACHQQKDLSRKDDVETWIYMQVELTASRLPWKDIQDMKQVGDYKQRIRNPAYTAELFPPPCPSGELRQILSMVNSLEYFDAPNYQAIYQLMRRALQNCGQPEFPYDWECNGPAAHVLL